jgi:hypothetical protein
MEDPMSNITTTGAPARTDVTTTAHPRTDDTRFTRRAGLALALGTASWATANLVFGFEPSAGDELAWKFTDLTGLAFQAGVMALLHVQMRTRATGVKAISRRLLKVERVLLSIAMLWSVLHAFLPSQRDAAWMHAIDMFWPLSMLGMFLIGIKVAIAGRWRGRARAWSALAETWAVLSVPAMAILGHDGGGDLFGAVHLLLGYTTLGLILATRPDLVRDRG